VTGCRNLKTRSYNSNPSQANFSTRQLPERTSTGMSNISMHEFCFEGGLNSILTRAAAIIMMMMMMMMMMIIIIIIIIIMLGFISIRNLIVSSSEFMHRPTIFSFIE
jgi:uncharacterized membrane protein